MKLQAATVTRQEILLLIADDSAENLTSDMCRKTERRHDLGQRLG